MGGFGIEIDQKLFCNPLYNHDVPQLCQNHAKVSILH